MRARSPDRRRRGQTSAIAIVVFVLIVLGVLYFLGYVLIAAAAGQMRVAVAERTLAMAAKEVLRIQAVNGTDGKVIIAIYSFWAGKSEIDHVTVRFSDGSKRTYQFSLGVGAYSAVFISPKTIDPSLPDDPRNFASRVAGISFHTKLGNAFGTEEEINMESTVTHTVHVTVTRTIEVTRTVTSTVG